MFFQKKEPLISIIIPSFNQGPYIERTINSVLKQDYPHKELIIMDGGSKDQTVEILQKYDKEISWVSEPDGGYADAVNKGLKMAKGSIIGIQSSDDYYCENIFGLVSKLSQLNKKIGLFGGRRIYVNDKGDVIKKDVIRKTQIHDFKDFITMNYIPPQDSTFVRS
jgi:glycosyltransferase involved in cell wall biosynthesis